MADPNMIDLNTLDVHDSFSVDIYEQPIEIEFETIVEESKPVEVPKTPIERIQKKALPRWFEEPVPEGTVVDWQRPSLIDTLKANFVEPAEVASEMVVGTLSYIPSWTAKVAGLSTGKITGIGEEATLARAQRWQENTSAVINKVMHAGIETKVSEGAQRKMEFISAVAEAPMEYLAKPLGTVYGRLLDSDVAGEMATETLDMTINLALLPLAGVKLKNKVKAKLREGDITAWKQAAENQRLADAQAELDVIREQEILQKMKFEQTVAEIAQRDRAIVEGLQKEEGLKDLVTRHNKMVDELMREPGVEPADVGKQWLERVEGFERIASSKAATQLELNRVYGDLYAEQLSRGMDTKLRVEKQKMYEDLWRDLDAKEQRILDNEYNPVFDEAEQRLMADRYMEYEARQAVLDKVFNEDHVVKFIDELEGRLSKRKPEEGTMAPVELNDLYEKYLFKRIGDDPKLAEIWRQWDEAQERLYRQTDATFENAIEHPRLQRLSIEDQTLRHRATIPGKRTKQVDRLTRRRGRLGAANPVVRKGIQKQYEAVAGLANDVFASETGRLLAQEAPTTGPRIIEKEAYIPPADKTELDIEMRRTKLQEDTQKISKDIDGVLSKEVKPSEGKGLSKDDVDDLINFLREEASMVKDPTTKITPKQKKKAAVKAKQMINDLDDYMAESLELQKSNFEASLDMESPRDLIDIWEDLKLLTDERGSVGNLDPTPGRAQAINRLVKDVQFLRRRAAQQGKRLVDYMVENGFARDIAEAVERRANEMLDSESNDFSRAGDYPPGDARNVQRMFEETEKAMAAEAKRTFKDSLKDFRKEIYARDGDVKQFLKNDPSKQAMRAWNRKVLTPGAYPAASRYFDKVSKNIFGHLKKHEIEATNKLIHVRTEINKMYRSAKNRTPEGTTYADYVAFMDNAQQNLKLSDASYRKVVQATDDYIYTFNDLLLKQFEEGAIPKWLYTMLKENEYAPTSWLQAKRLFDYANEEGIPLAKGKRPPNSLAELEQLVHNRVSTKTGDLSVRERNLYELKGGMEGYRNLNYQQLLAEAVTKSYTWIYDNRATKSLGKLAIEKGIDGDVVRTAEIRKSYVDTGGEVYHSYTKPEPGWKELSYFDNGQKVVFHARDWFAEQWSKNSTQGKYLTLMGKRLDWIGNILRWSATGPGAPLFGLTKGIFMDTFYGYIAAQAKNPDGKYVGAYSSFFPKYLYQVGRNISKNAPDVIMKKGKFLDAIEDGMLFNALAQTEGSAPKVRSRFGRWSTKVNDFFGYMNNTMEYMVRMSHREQFIEQGYSPWEATAMARDMLDYAQGGWAIKRIDQGVPYTNTAIQGTRGLIRAAKNNPKEFAFKAANLSAFSAALYAINRAWNKESYDQETSYNRDNNFVIPTGFSLTDDYGNTRHLNILLKKDPGQALICTTAELMMARAMGDEVEFKRLLNTGLGLISPWQKIPNVPLIDMGLTYALNKDMLTFADVWKGAPAGNKEWDEKTTSKLWYDIGQITGGSPERMKAAVEALVTRDNFILETTGHLYDKAFKNLPQRERESLVATFLLDNWAQDIFSLTREPTNYYDAMKKDEQDFNGKRVMLNTNLDAWADQYFVYAKTDEEKKEAWTRTMNVIRTQDKKEQRRLINRFKVHGQTVGFPHQNMWKAFAGVSNSEVRAKHIWKWRNEFPTLEERQEIDRRLYMLKNSDASFIPKDMSSEFWKAYKREMLASRGGISTLGE